MKLSQLVELPKKTEQSPFKMIWENNQIAGRNKIIDELSNLEVSKEKVLDLVMINEDKVAEVVMCVFLRVMDNQMKQAIKNTEEKGFNWSTEGWSLETKDIGINIAKAISNDIKDILTIKD